MGTLHTNLPRARCIPDQARTTFNGAIKSLLALISAFLSVETDTAVMQGERTTAPGLTGEIFEKGGGCSRKDNFNIPAFPGLFRMLAIRLEYANATMSSEGASQLTGHISPSPRPCVSTRGSTSRSLYGCALASIGAFSHRSSPFTGKSRTTTPLATIACVC